MKREEFLAKFDKDYIDADYKDALGEAIYESIMEDDTNCFEIGKYVLRTLSLCDTEKEFQIADSMLIAICGWGIETLLTRIENRGIEPEME